MRHGIAILTIMVVAGVSPAEALKLTNRDSSEHRFTIQENSGAREQALKPSETLNGACNNGCTIKMQDGEEYEFDGNEIVSIEEGLMFLDEPAQGAGEPKR